MTLAVLLVGGAATPGVVWRRVVRRSARAAAVPGDQRTEMTVVVRPGGALGLRSEADRVARAAATSVAQGREVILVGHSMGGFVVEAVARWHPQLISGLVLLDSSVTTEDDAVPDWVVRRRRGARHLPASVRHLLGPGIDWAAYTDLRAQLQELRRQRPLPAIPVEVLTVLPRGAARAAWRRRQVELAASLAAEGATVQRREGPGLHLLMLDRPDVVSDAVRRAARARPGR